jgi:alkylhydroperoxidase/carboxymuconolactone decarboxylase family protein YurZ
MLPQQKEAFDAFYKSARYSGVIDNKTSLMIHLASSLAVACIPCASYYLEQVDEVGLTDDEISAIKTIVMAVSAGRVMMQFDEVLNSGAEGYLEDNGCDN